jgi:hypothetical protein
MDIGEQRRAWLDRRQFLLTASRFLQLGHKPRHIRKALHLSARQFGKAVQHAARSRRLMRDIVDGMKDPSNYLDPSKCPPSS